MLRQCMHLVHVPVVVGIPHVRAQTLDTLGCVCPDFTITEECESVAVSVFDIVIFVARLLDRLEEVDSLSHEPC